MATTGFSGAIRLHNSSFSAPSGVILSPPETFFRTSTLRADFLSDRKFPRTDFSSSFSPGFYRWSSDVVPFPRLIVDWSFLSRCYGRTGINHREGFPVSTPSVNQIAEPEPGPISEGRLRGVSLAPLPSPLALSFPHYSWGTVCLFVFEVREQKKKFLLFTPFLDSPECQVTCLYRSILHIDDQAVRSGGAYPYIFISLWFS